MQRWTCGLIGESKRQSSTSIMVHEGSLLMCQLLTSPNRKEKRLVTEM